jgi:hypothetical protein
MELKPGFFTSMWLKFWVSPFCVAHSEVFYSISGLYPAFHPLSHDTERPLMRTAGSNPYSRDKK